MRVKTAIIKAVKAGWDEKYHGKEVKAIILEKWEGETYIYLNGGTQILSTTLLDITFWEALGVREEWPENKFYPHDLVHPLIGEHMPEAQWRMRCFANNLWEGKDIEKAFDSATKE